MPAFRESLQLQASGTNTELTSEVNLCSRAEAMYLSGLVGLKRGICFADFSDAPPFFELSEAVQAGGEWAGVFRLRERDDTYIVLTDPLGYYSLFYHIRTSNGETTLTLGTNFQAVVDRLESGPRDPEINWPVVLTHLVAKHTLFQTAYTNETMDSEIRILGADEYLVVRPGGVEVGDRNLFSDSARRSYDDLLEQGIERSIGVIASAADSDIAGKRINLSGGKDSRMVLALLIASGRHSEFTVTTVNPESWGNASARPALARDLQIADFLRARFGMKWSEPMNYVSKRHSFHETVQRWQSQWSNRKFKMAIGADLVWPEEPSIALRGGGGELMRATDLSATALVELHRLGVDTADTVTSLRALFESWVPATAISSSHYDQMFSVFGDSVMAGEDVGLEEALNRHYARHRNRHHFGHGINSLAQNEIPLHPLSQPEFSMAANMLTMAERRSGVAAFDLIAALVPELNHIEFDSSDWSREVLSREVSKYGRSVPVVEQSRPGSAGVRLLQKIDGINLASRRSPKRITRTSLELDSLGTTYNGHQTLEYQARRDLVTLYETSEQTHGYLTLKLVQRLIAGSRGSTAALASLVPKLESAMDVVSVCAASHTKLDVYLGDHHTSRLVNRFMVPLADHGSNARVLITPFEQRPTLVAAGSDALVASANPRTTIPEKAMFAFYLYRNGERIATKWYQKSPEATFLVTDAGTYVAKVFVRIAGNALLTLSQDSKPVEK